MKRVFHLSHLLDEQGYNRIDLVTFHELSKLDGYIMERFQNHQDVRKMFDLDIGEHCLNNMKKIQEENKRNHRNWTGSIAIICEEKDQNNKTTAMYKIPIIYKKQPKLLSKEDCLKKIKESINDKKVMLAIYQEKRELLSQNEIDLIRLYMKSHDEQRLKSAMGFFYNRLKRMDNDETLYTYCRALMHKCNLNTLTIRTQFGTINMYGPYIPNKTMLVKEGSYPSKLKIDELIKEENYEELFNLYDLDEIYLNSDMFEKGRKK